MAGRFHRLTQRECSRPVIGNQHKFPLIMGFAHVRAGHHAPAAVQNARQAQLIEDFVKNSPKDWNKKNLQVVLHTDVVNGIPSLPEVVAVHFW